MVSVPINQEQMQQEMQQASWQGVVHIIKSTVTRYLQPSEI